MNTAVAVVGLNLAVEVLAAGLGEDLDPPHTDAVVFGGERVLIDAHFANRRLRRQTAAGETIDVDLSAIRPRGRTRQRGKIGRQIVPVVRQGIQFFAAHHQRAGIVAKGPLAS